MEYIYHGDRLTDPKYKKQPCQAVRRANGKCMRGRNGSMIVKFESGETVIVIARLLRKIKLKIKLNDTQIKNMA